MTLAKSSLEVAREYLELVPPSSSRTALRRRSRRSTSARSRRCSTIVEERGCSTGTPSSGASIQLRNPYVDPMNAIQVELLRRYRGGDDGSASAARPLLRSIAGIAAALRNTG